MGVGPVKGNEQHPEGKETGEGKPEGGIGLEDGFSLQPLDACAAKQAGDAGSEKHGEESPRLHDDEGEGEPGKNTVTDGVPHEGKTAHHDEGADQTA